MKSIRLPSNILFYICYPISRLYGIAAVYVVGVILLSYINNGAWVPINVVNERFIIYYPFTSTAFVLGDYTPGYLVPVLATMIFYTVFLLTLTGVFNALRQKKLFVENGTIHLSRFYKVNVLLPLMLLLAAFIYSPEPADFVMITFLHEILGLFAFFMAAIFNQGLELQAEQDLTI